MPRKPSDLHSTIRSLRRSLDEVMLSDYPRLRDTLASLSDLKNGKDDHAEHRLVSLEKQIEVSKLRVEHRKHHGLPLRGHPDLPISAKFDQIVEAIRDHQVLIIAGETGSGKTTQIPKMCLAAGRGCRGLIGLTQPRRIAAISIAQRLAEEFGPNAVRAVSYKIRFEEQHSSASLIKVMTDGIALAETQGDPHLLAYDTLIIDEAHERSLNIDFLLGYLRRLLATDRPDLKVIITSATIDTAKFSEAFQGAPVIEVSGRMFPVTVRYRPPSSSTDDQDEVSYIDEAVACVEELEREHRFDDILVFLPTEQDIRETCQRLSKRCQGLVLPLFARLSTRAQRQVFAPSDRRKIIVATNIAETSLTLPGIRYVIDSGLARMLEYNPRSQTNGLPVRPISRSSADQRKGRCGRVRDGICIRLYSESDYLDRPQYTQPEIQRANLAGVILRMLSLGLGSIDAFPFVDPPDPRSIRDGLDTLRELGALPATGSRLPSGPALTAVGREMSKYPLDPRVSRMLIESRKENCVSATAVIAAGLSISDPRERPYDKLKEAQVAHAPYQHPESDFLGLIALWNQFSSLIESAASQSRLRAYCRDHFLSYRRMMEWRDIFSQLIRIVEEAGFSVIDTKANQIIDVDQALSDRITRCILSGYLSHIAKKKEKNMYTAARGREIMLHPSSGQFNRGAPWIVAAEISRTSRLFGRLVATVQSDWLEEVGKDQCRYTHSEPHWEKNQGRVVAREKVTIFGLTLVEQRTIAFDRIDPAESRRIFIRDALVCGSVSMPIPFLEHNLSLYERVRSLEDKLRTRGVAIDEEGLVALYDKRLPPVSDIRSLLKHIRDRGTDQFLRLGEDELTVSLPDPQDLANFPDRVALKHNTLPCRYTFAPGHEDDGITVKIPVGLISQTDTLAIEKQFPTLVENKVMRLVKTLPKTFKQKLPAGVNIAKLFADREVSTSVPGSLPRALSAFLQEQYRIAIPPETWAVDKLPDHLRIRYSLTDEEGQEVASSRDDVALDADRMDAALDATLKQARTNWERSGLSAWDFGEIPEAIPLSGKKELLGYAYPALTDEEGIVSLRLYHDPDTARAAHIQGVVALYRHVFSDKLKHMKKAVALTGEARQNVLTLGAASTWEKAILDRVSHDLFGKPWRHQADFEEHGRKLAADLLSECRKVYDAAVVVIKPYADLHASLHKLLEKNRSNAPCVAFLNDLLSDARCLAPIDYARLYPPERMLELPRYLKALDIRAKRGVLNLQTALQKTREVDIYRKQWHEAKQSVTSHTSSEKLHLIDDLFWAIEELKVSVFAQELKTKMKISPAILDALIALIQEKI